MASKSHNHRSKSSKNNKKSKILKNIQNTSKRVLPEINSGLKTVGTSVKSAAIKSAPVVEKGISGIYGALASVFDMGAKKVKTMMYKNKNKTRKHKKH